MKQVTIDLDRAMTVLNSDDSSGEDKLIAACSAALLFAKNVISTSGETRAITQRMLRMAAYAIDEGIDRDSLN